MKKRHPLIFFLLAMQVLFYEKGSAQSMVEEFDNGIPVGWDTINKSGPSKGLTNWFSGISSLAFSQNSGTDFISANFNNVGGPGTISNWLIAPSRFMNNGDQIIFYTRTTDSTGTVYPDRLQVRLSTNAGSSNVGTSPTTTGDFSTQLLEINPSQTTNGYPRVWKKYTITISGLSGSNVNGRFAFRYFVTNAGPGASNSDLIGIDSAAYVSTMNSVQELKAPLSFEVYPNPSKGHVNLRFDGISTGEKTVSVNDILGNIVFESSAHTSFMEMNLDMLDKGFYFITVKDREHVGTKRLVLQ